MSLIVAKKIEKKFFHPKETFVLKGIDITIEKQEITSIIGPSGSGKSTLLHILGTLEPQTSGTIEYFNHETDFSHIRSHKVGFVFQSSNLLEEFTLLENLLIKAKIARRATHKHSEAYKEALDLLDCVQLSHRKDFAVKYLSGGEKQRGAIARALLNNPELILADEPTGNLDINSSCHVQEILIDSCRHLQKSLVVVTHDLLFAKKCDRTLQLRDGFLSATI